MTRIRGIRPNRARFFPVPLFFFPFLRIVRDGTSRQLRADNGRPFVESGSPFLCRWLTSRVAWPGSVVRRRLCAESGRNRELLRNFPKIAQSVRANGRRAATAAGTGERPGTGGAGRDGGHNDGGTRERRAVADEETIN